MKLNLSPECAQCTKEPAITEWAQEMAALEAQLEEVDSVFVREGSVVCGGMCVLRGTDVYCQAQLKNPEISVIGSIENFWMAVGGTYIGQTPVVHQPAK